MYSILTSTPLDPHHRPLFTIISNPQGEYGSLEVAERVLNERIYLDALNYTRLVVEKGIYSHNASPISRRLLVYFGSDLTTSPGIYLLSGFDYYHLVARGYKIRLPIEPEFHFVYRCAIPVVSDHLRAFKNEPLLETVFKLYDSEDKTTELLKNAPKILEAVSCGDYTTLRAILKVLYPDLLEDALSYLVGITERFVEEL